jgi:uncharacterized protein (TIGR02117 family)
VALRWLKKLLTYILASVILLIAAAWLTSREGDRNLYPVRNTSGVFEVFVVSHGYHAGIALRRSDISKLTDNPALLAISTRFANYEWIEFGWGDEGFYREVPEISSLTIRLAFKALFLPGNRSVLHVVGLARLPREIFPRSEIVRLHLSEEGLTRLLRALDRSFAREPNGAIPGDLGRGLYGPSLFYRATGTFSILKVCNHWVADLLDQAGVPTTPILDTVTSGLLFDLKWRAGAVEATR